MDKLLGRTLTCVVGCLAAQMAHAQSGVTLYGVIDDGLTYVSNASGHHAFKMEDSIASGDNFGFKGVEDLGGGLSTVFDLEGGFNPNTGASRQGGLEFGRKAYVGLSSTQYGTLTLGRQFDQMVITLLRYAGINTGLYSLDPGDQDRLSGEYLNNLVTYNSPNFHGFNLNAQYSFNSASAPTLNYGRALSLGSNYVNGPFSAGAAVTDIHDYFFAPASGMGVASFLGHAYSTTSTATAAVQTYRTAGVGTGWDAGKWGVSALYTNTLFENPGVSSTLQSFHGGAQVYLFPYLMLAGGYTFSKLDSSKWNEFALEADYLLSKRTDVYLSGNYEKASGDGTRAVLLTETGSSNDKQLAVRIGLRQRF